MKLYHNPVSPNCRRVLMTAAYLGIPLEEKPMDFAKGDHQTPEFLAINPNGMIPTLVDGDLILWESRAIMQYLAAKKPKSGLLGKNETERAEVTKWLLWDAGHLARHIGTVIYETMVKRMFGTGEPDMAAVAAAMEQVKRFCAVLDQSLKGRKYLVGDALTIADLAIAATFTYADAMKLSMKDTPNIKAWLARIAALDCWKKTLPPMPAAAE